MLRLMRVSRGKAVEMPEQRGAQTKDGEPLRDGGPAEAAGFLAEMMFDFAKLARRHKLDTLAFLLDMAHLEAKEIVRVDAERRTR